MKKIKIVHELPFDCCCEIISYLLSHNDYLNFCLCLRGLIEYTQNNYWCLTYIYIITEFRKLTTEEKERVTYLNWIVTGISKIEGLKELNQLQVLDLFDNQITKIEGVNELNQLQKLDLSQNKISKIEGLEKLNQLQRLNLYRNKITNMESLNELRKRIKTVYL